MPATLSKSGTIMNVKLKSRTRNALLVLALSGVAVSAFAVVLSNKTSIITEKQLIARLTDCASTNDSIRRQCLKDLIIQADENDMYPTLRDAMGAIGAKDGMFQGDCHGASHDVGATIIAVYLKRAADVGLPTDVAESTAKAMANMDSEVCGSSMAHGLAEAFADQPRSLESWQRVLKECSILQATNQSTKYGCAHGVGHGLVIATKKGASDAGLSGASIGELLTFCEANSFDAEGKKGPGTGSTRASCAYGVMMGSFAPITKQMTRLDNPADLVTYCLPSKDSDIKQGCFSGAGYALGTNLSTIDKSEDSLKQMLLSCASTSLTSSQEDKSLIDQCRGQVLLHLRSNVVDQGEGFVKEITSRCTTLEKDLGQKQAVDCIAGLNLAEGSILFEQIVKEAGPLGEQAQELIKSGRSLT